MKLINKLWYELTTLFHFWCNLDSWCVFINLMIKTNKIRRSDMVWLSVSFLKKNHFNSVFLIILICNTNKIYPVNPHFLPHQWVQIRTTQVVTYKRSNGILPKIISGSKNSSNHYQLHQSMIFSDCIAIRKFRPDHGTRGKLFRVNARFVQPLW